MSENTATQAPSPPKPKSLIRKEWFENLFNLYPVKETSTISIRIPLPYKVAYESLTDAEKAYIKDRVVSHIRSLFYDSDRAIPEGPRVIQVQEAIKPDDLLNTIEAAAEKCAEKLLLKVKTQQSKHSRKELEELLDAVREIKGRLEHELPSQLQADKSRYAAYYKSKLQPKLVAALERLNKLLEG